MDIAGLVPISGASAAAAGITTMSGEFFGLGIYALLLAAEKEAKTRGLDCKPAALEDTKLAMILPEGVSILASYEDFSDRPSRYKTLAPEIAEIVAARLARAAGIGAPEGFRDVSADEARALDPLKYVLKAWRNGRIKAALPGQAQRFFACPNIPGTYRDTGAAVEGQRGTRVDSALFRRFRTAKKQVCH